MNKTPAPVGTGVSVAGEGLEPSTSRLLARVDRTLRVRLEWMDFQLRWRFRGAHFLSPAAVEARVAHCLLSFASITGNRTLGGNDADVNVTSATGDAAMTGIGTVSAVRGNRAVAGDSSNDAAGAVNNAAPLQG